MVILISDFFDNDIASILPIIAKKCDVVAFRCSDKNERKFPSVGFVTLQDLETGEYYTIDARAGTSTSWAVHEEIVQNQAILFQKNGVDLLDVRTDQAWIGNVINFFRRRVTTLG
jgi:hypothetical protein